VPLAYMTYLIEYIAASLSYKVSWPIEISGASIEKNNSKCLIITGLM